MNRFLARYLWVVPLVTHLAYALATIPTLPVSIGPVRSFAGNVPAFIVQWVGTLLFANGALLFTTIWMPRFNDKLLSVPNKAYWFADAERRSELVERLRGIVDTSLFLFNVFFLGIYQWIYQTNVLEPVLRIPRNVLWVGFIAIPIATMFISLAFSLYGLKKPTGSNERQDD